MSVEVESDYEDVNESGHSGGGEVIKMSDIIAPSFYEAAELIRQEKYTHYWFKGGRGSTKSSFVSVMIVLGIVTHPGTHAVVFRRVTGTLEDSVVAQVAWAIDKLGLSNRFKYKKNPYKFIYVPTGQTIFFRGLDDPTKVKGFKNATGYTRYAWFEELDQFKNYKEIRSVNQSLMRGSGHNIFQFFYTYNPPMTAASWVNLEAINVTPNRYLNASTYLTVPREWLGDPFFEEAEILKAQDERAYRHEYLGEVTGTGGAVFANLEIREITDEEINTMFDNVNFGVDFGYTNSFAWTAVNYSKKQKSIFIYDEIAASHMIPRQSAELIKKKNMHGKPIYADCEDACQIANFNREYGIYMIPVHKGPDSRRYGYRSLQDLRKIVIDPKRCPRCAYEFQKMEFLKDEATGQFIEDYPKTDDHCVSGDTIVITDAGEKRISDLVGSEGKVLSYDYEGRFVWKGYRDCRVTREDAELIEMELEDGRTIRATADHLVMTDTGWRMLGSLKEGDTVLSY